MTKGRTCANCAGACCTLKGKAPPGSWLQHHFKQCTVKTIKRLGGEVIHEKTDYSCLKQRPDGSCSDYENRPALCRSYYCHGKLWEPKPEVKEIDIIPLRDRLRDFCVEQMRQLFDTGKFDKFARLLERGDGPVQISFKLKLPTEVVKMLRGSDGG